MPNKRSAIIIAVVALLLLFALLALLPKETEPTGDLALTFVGITNNPTPSFRPVRVSMIRGATGVCAVFRVSNVTRNYFVDYQGIAVEVRTNANAPWLACVGSSTIGSDAAFSTCRITLGTPSVRPRWRRACRLRCRTAA